MVSGLAISLVGQTVFQIVIFLHFLLEPFQAGFISSNVLCSRNQRAWFFAKKRGLKWIHLRWSAYLIWRWAEWSRISFDFSIFGSKNENVGLVILILKEYVEPKNEYKNQLNDRLVTKSHWIGYRDEKFRERGWFRIWMRCIELADLAKKDPQSSRLEPQRPNNQSLCDQRDTVFLKSVIKRMFSR